MRWLKTNTKLTEISAKYSSYLVSTGKIITDISNDFISLTGFTREEIITEDTYMFLSEKLRLPHNIFNDINASQITLCYLFTKELNAIEVEIYFTPENEYNDVTFYFNKISASSLDVLLPYANQLLSDNVVGMAIYSYPSFILLKANQKYFNDVDKNMSFEKCFGNNAYELFPSFKHSALEKECCKIALAKKTVYFENNKFDKNNEAYYCAANIIAPVIVDNKVKCLIHHHTKAKTISSDNEDIVNKLTAQLEAIVVNLSKALFIVDASGNFITVNKSAKELFTYRKFNDKFEYTSIKAGDPYTVIELYNEDGSKISVKDNPVMHVLNSSIVVNRRCVIKNKFTNVYIDVSGAPVYDKKLNIVMGVFYNTNVSEQVKHENFTETRSDYLYEILDALDLPIMRYSYPDNNLIEINKCAKKDILKFIDFDNLNHKNLTLNNLKVFTDNSDNNCISEIEDTKEAVCIKKYEILKDGNPSYYNIVLQPILNINGLITEIIFLGIDITNEVLENINIEDSLKLRDEFFSTITHELKTPITVIDAAIQAMEFICKDELSDKAQSFVNKIKQNSYRLRRLVNNLLDITRIKADRLNLHKKNIDIVGLTREITESVNIYAQQKGIKLTFTSTFGQKVIAIDEEKFDRILLNLLSNAIKFTSKGKCITVKVGSKTGHVCIEVKDEGIGIPKNKRELIFEKFGQVDSALSRQAEGSGIGLSLVQMFVELLGGSISLESKEDKGSTFTILLPSKRITENKKNKIEINGDRLLNETAIEFSDVYLNLL